MPFGLNISRGRLLLEPEVDGIATDLKDYAGFTAVHPILFNRCHDFAAQVVTVRFCYRCYARDTLAYGLICMAAAIPCLLPAF